MKLSDYKVIRSGLIATAERIENDKRPGYTVGSDDVLANFKEVSRRINRPPEEVCMVYFLKHVDSIIAMVKNPELPESEPREERFADAINYLKFLFALIAERDQVASATKESNSG